MRIDIARASDASTVLTLVEELLHELGSEGDEFAEIDRAKIEAALRAALPAPESTPEPTPGSPTRAHRAV